MNILRYLKPRPRALADGDQVRLVPALRAAPPAPTMTYTISSTRPFTNVRPRCATHKSPCPGPWWALTDHNGRHVGVCCSGELEAL